MMVSITSTQDRHSREFPRPEHRTAEETLVTRPYLCMSFEITYRRDLG